MQSKIMGAVTEFQLKKRLTLFAYTLYLLIILSIPVFLNQLFLDFLSLSDKIHLCHYSYKGGLNYGI